MPETYSIALIMSSLIATAGFLWRADKVCWGSHGVKGSVEGTRVGSKKTRVDFADQVGIYALYAEFRLVYVGQTGKGRQTLLKRLREHVR